MRPQQGHCTDLLPSDECSKFIFQKNSLTFFFFSIFLDSTFLTKLFLPENVVNFKVLYRNSYFLKAFQKFSWRMQNCRCIPKIQLPLRNANVVQKFFILCKKHWCISKISSVCVLFVDTVCIFLYHAGNVKYTGIVGIDIRVSLHVMRLAIRESGSRMKHKIAQIRNS